jgi:acylphosphatase
MAERTVLVRYTGDVQGVGFRANARTIAGGFKIRGWVKNEPDGSVSLIATAEAAELEAFLQAIRDSGLGSHIEREVIEPQPHPASANGFDIRR